MGRQVFGIVGLGVMGHNLALNVERNGYSVAGFDMDSSKSGSASQKFKGKNIRVLPSLIDFVQALETPRKILMMVPAGDSVDAVIRDIQPLLSSGDILIDGGNSYFGDTNRRIRDIQESGTVYVGCGFSGGEEGALWGPAIMPGGNSQAWPSIQPILQAVAAKVKDGTPCCQWMGPGGAGHFVKMVHNGIEYADMQIICESYFLMSRFLGMSPAEMSSVFYDWNEGELSSYLIEITGEILSRKDPETSKALVDMILDTAGQKGTGKWTSRVALDLGVPANTIAEAVFARMISGLKEERVEASRKLSGSDVSFRGDRNEFIEMIRCSLYASKICCYAQGFQILHAANEEYGWTLQLGEIALLWRAGCIIRAQFLERIMEAFKETSNLKNLLLDPYFKSAINENQHAWRHVVSQAVQAGIPTLVFSSSLAYYDSYRSAVLPANLLQAQRDYFGAHTYERLDRPRGEFFHTRW